METLPSRLAKIFPMSLTIPLRISYGWYRQDRYDLLSAALQEIARPMFQVIPFDGGSWRPRWRAVSYPPWLAERVSDRR